MKRLIAATISILLFLVAGALAQGPNDSNAGSQLTLNGTTGAYTFTWWGTAGYTYLIETSDDLVKWSYLPIVESGSDAVIQWGFTSNSSSLFMQLEYITVPASRLSGAIFNGPEDTSNGLPGDWELFYFGTLGVDPNMDPNGEGFTVLQDYENGNNPIANQVVSVGPTAGEYLFHETSGTIAHDISSLHNNGLLSGGAGWTGAGNGYDGQGAITFDGTSGELLISDTGNQVLPVASAPFSFALWINANAASLSGTTTLMTDEIAGASGFEFAIDSTTSPPSLLFSTAGSGGFQIETPFQPGVWTQAAVTYDGTTAAIYVNGFPETSGTGILLSNTNTITLANGLSGNQPFAGAMENLAFYQAVLQQSDVDSIYNLSTTTTGPDSSALPNYWKYQYFGALNLDPNAFVAWSGSQVTILQAYQQGLNPIEFYNGQTPTLTIVSGNNQTGPQNGFAPLALVVSVTDTNGNPLYDAPVTFTVTSGSGQMQRSNITTPATTVTVLANSNGHAQAEAFFQLPNIPSNTSQITATAGPAAQPAQVTFTESSDNGSGGPYGSPFSPSNVMVTLNADGSADMTWQNNTDPSDQTPIPIWEEVHNVWTQIDSVPAGTTSYHAPPP